MKRARPSRIPFRIRPMLATLVETPFHTPGWVYEEKYDGYRILAYKEGGTVMLISRNGKDRTETFAEVARAIGTLRERTLLLDGEVVAFDKKLVSRFQLLQQGEVPTVYAVFDCLYRHGRDLRGQELPARREALEGAIGRTDRLFPSRRLAGNGLEAYRIARKKGFEGLVAKDPSAPYVEGRSRRWLKVKVHQEEEFVIGGFTAPAGTRQHFGAILVGAHRGRDLIYAGRVGTGFSEKTLSQLSAKFASLVRSASPFANLPREKAATWIAPKLVAQVAFHEWTSDEKLRQPVFLGLRDDKAPSGVVMPRIPR